MKMERHAVSFDISVSSTGFRLLFATKESRLIKCTAWNKSDHL